MQVTQMSLGAIIEKVNGSVESMTANVPQNSVQPQEANISIIHTKVIGNDLMLIDEKNQKVQFPKMSTKDALINYIGVASGNTAIYNFSDIIGYEVLENIHSVNKRSLGGALVGGLAFW